VGVETTDKILSQATASAYLKVTEIWFRMLKTYKRKRQIDREIYTVSSIVGMKTPV
jgi:hypothetical protein